MARELAGLTGIFLSLLLGACGGPADEAGATNSLAGAGAPDAAPAENRCVCVLEYVKDGDLMRRVVPAGCVATADDLPACAVWHPVPGTNPPVAPQ